MKVVLLQQVLDDLGLGTLPVVVERAVDVLAEEPVDPERAGLVNNVRMVGPAGNDKA